ncbi:MAG: LytTR family transcriptional regulator DNA-binding domain-containing protein [Bacteroidota bacterium]
MISETLSILIVEDDLSFAIELDMLVRELGYNVASRVDNSAEALEMILTQSPDFILMDIDIKGRLTGIEIAEKISHLPIPVLFITSFGQEDFYQKAKLTNFVGYLVKPINKYSLRSALDLAFQKIYSTPDRAIQPTEASMSTGESISAKETSPLKDYLFFKKKGVFQRVKIEDICSVEANSDYCLVHTEKGDYIASQRLSQMETLLRARPFMRIHRSFIINLKKIESVDPVDNFVMIKGKSISISRSKKDTLLQQLNMIK